MTWKAKVLARWLAVTILLVLSSPFTQAAVRIAIMFSEVPPQMLAGKKIVLAPLLVKKFPAVATLTKK
jgi:hypothetical protein